MVTSTPTEVPIPGASISINRFANHTIIETHYKRLSPTHQIPASIILPKDLKPSPDTKRPLAVFWHGGALILGQRIYSDWQSSWILDFVKQHDAVLVNPDYRLLPEHSGKDILEDVRDFFAWLTDPAGLSAVLPEGIEVDTSDVLVTGGSAGGYLSVQSALTTLPDEQRRSIKAVIAQYPMLDMRDRWWTEEYEKNLFSAGANLPKDLLAEYLASLKGDEIVTSRIPPDGGMLSASIIQQGVFPKFLGTEPELYPLEVLQQRAKAGQRVPPMWLFHGTEDDVVPVQGTEAFVNLWKKVLPGKEGELHVNYEAGSHGFDDVATLETPWIKSGVQFIETFWPAGVKA